MQFTVLLRNRLAIALTVAVAGSSVAALAQAPAAPKPAPAAQGAKPAPAAPAKPAPTAPGKPATLARPAAPAAAALGPVSDRFIATAANLNAIAGETITIDVVKWSSDGDRDKMTGALAKGEPTLYTALQQSPTIGYIWRSGSGLGSIIRYAYRFKEADGEHFVIATDANLMAWQDPAAANAPPAPAAPAPAAGAKPAPTPPPAAGAAAGAKPAPGPRQFTVVEIVVPATGPSGGKMSLTGNIVTDPATKTFRLENYAAAPVTLKGVRHISKG